jgi:acyl-CoA synthetase (AMP-forming)/AMP-acid ligase II
MVVLPFFYVMGKSLLNTHFAVGGRIVINNKFAYPASVINQMVVEQVTGFSGVPSTYSFLIHNSPLAASREKLQSLRYCSQAGGHMASSLKRQLLTILPETTKLVVMYGATEASARLAYVEPAMLEKKIDSIGRAIPGVTLRVLDTNGTEVLPGSVGELVASGPNIMQGYWQDAAATQQALTTQGYHTGDLGYQDEDGYYFVVGRRDDQLKVGGHRINPQSIEDVILATNLVAEVAVVGLPDLLLGRSLAALVVPTAGVEDVVQKLMKECSAQLAQYQVPQLIVPVDTLPKNSSGKVDRKRCEEICRVRRG